MGGPRTESFELKTVVLIKDGYTQKAASECKVWIVFWRIQGSCEIFCEAGPFHTSFRGTSGARSQVPSEEITRLERLISLDHNNRLLIPIMFGG